MKKAKIALVTIISLLFSITYFYHPFFSAYVYDLLIFILYYFGTYWILEFDIDILGVVTLLLFPSIFLSAISLVLFIYLPDVLSYLDINGFLKLLFIVFICGSILAFAGYSSISAMNIFNVSRYKRIPLLQAAQTIVYIYTIVGGYILFHFIYHFFNTQLFIALPLYMIGFGYYVFLNNWSIKLSIKENISYTLIALFVIFQIVGVLSFFPITFFYIVPLIVIVSLYIYNGILINLSKRNQIRRYAIEYILLGIILSIVLLLTSHWGIAGNILGL